MNGMEIFSSGSRAGPKLYVSWAVVADPEFTILTRHGRSQAFRALSSWSTKSACSGEFRPCWTTAKTVFKSPRIKAAGSSQRPGKTELRRNPSVPGSRDS